MEENKFQRIRFGAELSDVSDLNPSFALGKMRIAYVGDNRNGSSISKDVFIDAIPSMFNCPIVARYDRASDSFGSHDVELVVDNKTIKVVNVTQPVGLVPSTASWCFETTSDEDGNEHEYLVTDVILWKRQEAFEHIVNSEAIDESMECVFTESHYDSRGFLVADKMYFEAFCLLESASPCYEGACVATFSSEEKQEFKKQCELMLSEFSNFVSHRSDEGIEIDGFCNEGGKSVNFSDEIRDSILSEFSVNLEDINFEISEEMTEEEFREKVKEIASLPEEEPEVLDEPEEVKEPEMPEEPEVSGEPEDTSIQSFAVTYQQRREAIANALCNTEFVYFYLCDFDDKYAYVERTICNDGDYNFDHGRFEYEFDKETCSVSLVSEFEEMILTWLTVDENKALETRRAMIDELLDFKESTLSKTYAEEIEHIVEMFKDLSEVQEFSEYIALAKLGIEDTEKRLALNDIRERCFAIRGRCVGNFNQKLSEPKTPRVAIDFSSQISKQNSKYGHLFEKYAK